MQNGEKKEIKEKIPQYKGIVIDFGLDYADICRVLHTLSVATHKEEKWAFVLDDNKMKRARPDPFEFTKILNVDRDDTLELAKYEARCKQYRAILFVDIHSVPANTATGYAIHIGELVTNIEFIEQVKQFFKNDVHVAIGCRLFMDGQFL